MQLEYSELGPLDNARFHGSMNSSLQQDDAMMSDLDTQAGGRGMCSTGNLYPREEVVRTEGRKDDQWT